MAATPARYHAPVDAPRSFVPPAVCERIDHYYRLASARALWPSVIADLEVRQAVYLCGPCAEGPTAAALALVGGRPRPGFIIEEWPAGTPPEPPGPQQGRAPW